MKLIKINCLQKLILIIAACVLLYFSFNDNVDFNLSKAFGIVAAAIFLVYATNNINIPLRTSVFDKVKISLYSLMFVIVGAVALIACIEVTQTFQEAIINKEAVNASLPSENPYLKLMEEYDKTHPLDEKYSPSQKTYTDKDFENLANYDPFEKDRKIRMIIITIGSLLVFVLIGLVQAIQSHEENNKPMEIDLHGKYEAIIGKKNTKYYLRKFEQFDKLSPGLRPSWNWAAFFCTGAWTLYRKMYSWFFVFMGITLLSNICFKSGYPWAAALISIPPWIAFTIYSNFFYHRSIMKRILLAQLKYMHEHEIQEALIRKGGVNIWVIWVFGVLPIIGVLAAIIIPQIARH